MPSIFMRFLIQVYPFNQLTKPFKVPKLDKKLLDLIEQNPYETRSDSFYFVDGELIMHHRSPSRLTHTHTHFD